MMQADPHKLDFRSDLLARLPGAGGLGPLGPIGGALPPTHDLTRPPSLFSATATGARLKQEFNVDLTVLRRDHHHHHYFLPVTWCDHSWRCSCFSTSFLPAGAVNPSSGPFIPPSAPHSSFLAPSAHLGKKRNTTTVILKCKSVVCIGREVLMFTCRCVSDPYGRSPPFTPLGALGSGAFGGLGSPTLGQSHNMMRL